MTSYRDLFLGLIAFTIWATNATAIKFITLDLQPFTGLSMRLILGCVVFLPFLRWPGKEKFWLIFQITILMVALHWTSMIWAIDRIDASMAALLLQTQAIFSTLIGVFLFKESIGWRTVVGIILGILGVGVLVGLPQNPPSLAGVFAMLFSMLAFATSYARMKSLQDISPLNYAAYIHILPLPIIVAITFLIEQPLNIKWENVNIPILSGALLFQVIIITAAHIIWQRLMTRNAMSGLPNLALLTPVLGVIIAIILLGETVTPSMLIGGAITMTGVGIIMIRKHTKLT